QHLVADRRRDRTEWNDKNGETLTKADRGNDPEAEVLHFDQFPALLRPPVEADPFYLSEKLRHQSSGFNWRNALVPVIGFNFANLLFVYPFAVN
ncbi:unnamed protein product, partial [Amoebophrya sp. A120]